MLRASGLPSVEWGENFVVRGFRTRARVVGALTVCVSIGGFASGAGAAGTKPAPVIEAARQVTTDANPTRLFDVPTVVVDPRDPRTVVVAVGDARNGGCELRVSRDAGASWVTTAKNLMPANLPYCVHRNTGSYIAPAFASDGTLYVALSGTPANDHPNGPMTAIVSRTTDLGVTNELSTVATARTDLTFTSITGTTETNLIGQHRYASIAVDPHNPLRVYRGWRYGLRGTVVENAAPRIPYVATSLDGGKTWSEPVNTVTTIPSGEKIFAGDVPVMVVGNDGTVYSFTKEIQDVAIPAAQRGKIRLLMSTSTDGGKTWAATVINPGATSVTNPFAAIDPKTGEMYVTWDQREGNGPQQVLLMSSVDHGKTWTTPVSLPDDTAAKNIEHYNPGISVAPNGRVDVAWFDFRNDPYFVARTATAAPVVRYADIYMTSSFDGGKTWAPNQRVTDRAIDTSVGVTFSNYGLRGTVGIASTDASAYVVWPDSRAGHPDLEAEDAYFTRVRFADDAPTTAGGGTSSLEWVALGAAIAAIVGGLALGAGTRMVGTASPSRTEGAQPARG